MDTKTEKESNLSNGEVKKPVTHDVKKKPFIYKLFSQKKKEKVKKFDENEKIDCISKVIGSFGPFQRTFLIYYMIGYLISPFQNYGIVFYGAKPDFWCADLKNLTSSELSLIKNRCLANCTRYEYDRSEYQTTTISEFDLVCEREYLVSTSKSIYQAGYAFSSLFVGYMSDRYGRAPTFKLTLFFRNLGWIWSEFCTNN